MLQLLGADRGLTPEQWREEQFAAHRAEYAAMLAAQPERERRNVPLALSLARLDVLTFRDVTYTVQFLSWADGVELLKLRADMGAIGKAGLLREAENAARREKGEPELEYDHEPTLREMLTIMQRIAELFWRNVTLPAPPQPRGIRAFFARLRGAYASARAGEVPPVNPFLTMTEQEARELLDFFYECRTRSSVRLTSTETRLHLT
jgi:hypothetical protein